MNQSELITPKDKAQELMNLYNYQQRHYLRFDAKHCALIAVEEIIKLLYSLKLGNALSEEIEYFEEVKNELKKSE